MQGEIVEIDPLQCGAVEPPIATPSSNISPTSTASPSPSGRLAIRRSGASVVLSWPTSAAGYVLETAPTAPDGIWNPETTPIVVVGEENTVTLAAPDATRFFDCASPKLAWD